MAELGRVLALAVVDFAVALVHEEAGHGAGTGIAVLVRAPGGKVDVPVVQLDLDVAVGVCQVPAYRQTAVLRVLGDCGDIEELAGVVLDTRKKNKGGVIDVLVDVRKDLFCGDLVCALVWSDEDHVLLGI